MLIAQLSHAVNVRSVMSTIADRWSRLVLPKREFYFLVAMGSSSLVAFAPFARETSISDFFIYALLPIILVMANRKKASLTQPPSEIGLGLSIALIIGSFAFNYITGRFTGDYSYGLTDYVILITGIFSAFYSIETAFVKVGAFLLVSLRCATLALSFIYSSAFVSISDFFVSIVLSFSRVFVSPEIMAGSLPGEIVVGGEAGYASVFIGWACAGLEELALIAVILYILIFSFELARRKAVAWLTVGIIGSFLINIFRMVILVWIAYTRGTETMLWFHTHIGDVLFLLWIAAFWLLFFRFADSSPSTVDGD